MIRLGRGQVAKTEKETVLYQYSLLLEEMDGFSQRKPRVQRNDSIHVHEKTASFRLHFSQGTCIIPVEGNEAKELQAGSASFLEIRSWFLKTFPAIEAFYTKRAKLLEKTAV